MSEWYCEIEGAESGPFSVEELQFLRGRGKLAHDSKVRRAGDHSWQSAQVVPGLFESARTRRPERPSSPETAVDQQRSDAPPFEVEPSPPVHANDPVVAEASAPAAVIPALRPPARVDRVAPERRRRVLLAIGAACGLVCLILLLLMLFVRIDRVGVSEIAEAADGAAGAGEQNGVDEDSTPEAVSASDLDPTDNATLTAAEEGEGDNSKAESDPAAMPSEPQPKGNAYVLPDLTTPPNETPSGGGSGDDSEFFGVKAQGRKFVYIVDQSGSMSGRRFDRAREELLDAVKRLGPQQQFYVYFFADAPIPMQHSQASTPKLIPSTKSNVKSFEAWVNGQFTKGGTTAQAETISAALELEPDSVFFLSDGGFDEGTADIVRTINKRPKIPINTIGFEDRSSEELLKRMAHDSGGDYRFVP